MLYKRYVEMTRTHKRTIIAIIFGNNTPELFKSVIKSLKTYLIISNNIKIGYEKARQASNNKNVHLSIDDGRKLNASMLKKTVKIINKKKSAKRIDNSV